MFHFWSGQERQGPLPYLALVSFVFVLLISVEDLLISYLVLLF